ncbi:MAG: hypothetical protein ACYCSF_11830 [Acidimicrobiales bacterium]
MHETEERMLFVAPGTVSRVQVAPASLVTSTRATDAEVEES